MPRIRTIKPEMFDDPDIGRLCPLARWLFVGLFTQADRRGRLADEPDRIRLRVLGFDQKANVPALLSELHDAQMIVRYKVDTRAYIQIRSFEKHQRPHPTEAESQIPACSDENVRKHGEPLENTASREEVRLSKVDTGYLSTDTGSLDTGVPITSLALRAPVAEDGFEDFWQAYPGPRRKAKVDALKAWKQTADARPPLPALLGALEAQRRTADWIKEGGQFIPMPSSWLRGHRWLDSTERQPNVSAQTARMLAGFDDAPASEFQDPFKEPTH